MDLYEGIGRVLGPDDGESFWQPAPAHGYVTVKFSPLSVPTNAFSMGVQVIEPGCQLRVHAHQRAEEVLFVHAGRGVALVEGERHAIEPGSTVYAGRWVRHGLLNEGDVDLVVAWFILPPGLESVFPAVGRPRQPGTPAPPRFDRPADIQAALDRAFFAPPEHFATSPITEADPR